MGRKEVARRWSIDEDTRLRNLWPSATNTSELSNAFPDRNYNALSQRAHLLKVRRPVAHKLRGDTQIESMSDTGDAWLAGLIDGEGTIGFHRHPDGCQVVVGIASTFLPVLIEVVGLLGCGGISKNKRTNPRHVTGYTFFIRDRRKVAAVIAKIRPYLRIKAEQAKHLAEALDLNGDLKSEMIEYYASLFQKLNQRGVRNGNPDPFSALYADFRKHKRGNNGNF